jgi:hypothetical protein
MKETRVESRKKTSAADKFVKENSWNFARKLKVEKMSFAAEDCKF